MTDNIARHPKGTPTGGQFAPTERSYPQIGLSPTGEPPAPRDLIVAGDRPVSLRYVDYDDRLTREQIGMILHGAWLDAENDVDERFAEGAWDQAATIAEEEVNKAFEEERFDREWDELDEVEQAEVRSAVFDRDDSDPLKDLLRNTPSQLMRTSLGRPHERLSRSGAASGDRLDENGYRARHDAVAALLKDAGMDTDAPGVREALDELVTEGPYNWHEGVQLDVIFYGDVLDAVPSTRSDADENAGKVKVLEFAKPHILLIDKLNGSGYDTVVPAPLKRTLGQPTDDPFTQQARAYLDEDGGGYSWDEVCGLVKSAYGGEGAPRASWADPS